VRVHSRFYLIRHGQSTFNADGRFQGCCDEPVLTPDGILTAQAAGACLRNAGLQAVITSPLRRAMQTAEHIQASLGPDLPFEIERELREIDLPLWEGKTLSQVRTEFPKRYLPWKNEPHEFRMGDRFPVVDLFERAAGLWPHLLKRFRGQTVLLVTHGGAIRALIGTAIGMPVCRYHVLQQSNGGISLLEFPDGELSSSRVLTINATDYQGNHLALTDEPKSGRRVVAIPGPPFHADGAAVALLRRMKFHGVRIASQASLECARFLFDTLDLPPEGTVNAGAAACGFPQTVLALIDPTTLSETIASALSLPRAASQRLVIVPATLTIVDRQENEAISSVHCLNIFRGSPATVQYVDP
jgi:broad specificity phosphatase PhoE